MFFFEYLIKLLMGNSNNIFMGLVVVIFGYYGWLLWTINSKFNSFYNKWERHEDYLDEARKGVMNVDKEITKLEQMETRINEMNQSINEFKEDLLKELEEFKEDITKEAKFSRENILKEIEEESDDIKEVVKIVVGKYRNLTKYSREDLNLCRTVKNKEGGNHYKRKETEAQEKDEKG